MSAPVIIVIKGDNQFDEVAKQVQEALKGVQKETDSAGKSWISVGDIGSKVWGGIKTAVSAVMDTISTVATVSGTAFTALGIAGTVALTGIVSAGSDFEQKMANVASVTGATGEELAKMSQVALDLGSNSRAGAGAAAEAMYYLGSAGYDASQTVAALDGVINLATATMSNMAQTSETVVSTITAFGLQAEDATRVSNVFAAAIGKSQLEMGNLAEAIKYVAPVAGVLGFTLEETTATLAALSNAGFKGSMAGAALRNIMTDLLNPTDMARDALANYGLTFEQISPETNSFIDILRTLERVGISAADVMKIFGERGGPQLLALLQQGSGAVTELRNQITGTNAATEMMNAQLDTVRGAWDLLKAALEGVRIQLFQFLAPVMQSTIEYITRIVQQVRAWLETNGAVVSWGMVVVTAISAILGPIMLAIGAFTGLALAMVALAPVFVPLFGALATLIIGIISLVDVVRQADIDWQHAWEHVSEIASIVWDDITSIFSSVIDEWFPALQTAGNDFGDWWEIHHDALFQTAFDKWNEIKETITNAFDGPEDSVIGYLKKALKSFLHGEWDEGWENLGLAATQWMIWLGEAIAWWWEDWIYPFIWEHVVPAGEWLGEQFATAIENAIINSDLVDFLAYFFDMLSDIATFGTGPDFYKKFNEWRERFFNEQSDQGYGSQTNLPPEDRTYGGDHFDKRGSSSPGMGRTININSPVFNIQGGGDPGKQAKLIWRELQGLMQRGAI